MIKCSVCDKELFPREWITYGSRCEDCWSTNASYSDWYTVCIGKCSDVSNRDVGRRNKVARNYR